MVEEKPVMKVYTVVDIHIRWSDRRRINRVIETSHRSHQTVVT